MTWSVVIPSLACFIIHVLIFIHVRSSSFRVRNAVSAVHRNLARTRGRASSVLQQAIVVYCTFLVGWIPIFMVMTVDVQHHVDQVIYSSLHSMTIISSLIIVIYLILSNIEVKEYLQQKNRLRLRR